MSPAATPTSAQEAVERLKRQLTETPRAVRPLHHATLQFRLGMALAEVPGGDRAMNLGRAVHHYDKALSLFHRDTHPDHRARVLNARGAALRELGRAADAVEACSAAAAVMGESVSAWEAAAVHNNLGLALADMQRHEEAIAALQRAVDGFDRVAADGGQDAESTEPQRAMAHHNLGQVLAGSGRHQEAIGVYDAAIDWIDVQVLPFQWAMIRHASGVSSTATDDAAGAVDAFAGALSVFTRSRHPFQHALAKNNLGLAHAQLGGVTNLRRAAVAFSSALAVLDSRVHRELWSQAYTNLQSALTALADAGHDRSPSHHLIALAAEVDDESRIELLREELTRLLELPEPRRSDALASLEVETLALEEDAAIAVTAARLEVLLELPDDQLIIGLRALLRARTALADDGAEEAVLDDADWVLDQAISRGMLAPQRLRVRDHLAALGYERR